MVPISALWIPILLSAVLVFLVSFLVHMVFKYHANDMRRFPDEDAFLDAFRTLNIPPGTYAAPRPNSPKEMRTPEFQEKVKKNPGVGLTTWAGGSMSMGKGLAQWFVYSVVVGIFAAYIAGRALGPGVPYLQVFRFVGATAFMCYAVAGWQESIWYQRSWVTTAKNSFDGLLYGLLTAGVFGWLWPH
jgi:hypothetical protein